MTLRVDAPDDAYPDPATAAVEVEYADWACLVELWREMGWDPDRMRWADAPSEEE